MIKGLFVNHSSEIGGAETNLLNLLQYAEHGNYEPVGVILPGRGPLADLLITSGFPVRFVSYYAFHKLSPWRYVGTMFQLVKFIRELKPDVIHLNHQYLVAPIVQAGMLTRCPVVCHTRNYPKLSFLETNRKWLNQCSKMVVESKAVMDGYISLGMHRNHLYHIYNGVDVKTLDCKKRSRLDISIFGFTPNNGPFIGYIGRLVPEKGIEDLIRAIPSVLCNFPNAQVIICGQDQTSGRYEKELKELVHKLLLVDKVKFLGFHRNIERILALIDVLVIPSRSSMREGFPLTAIEGLASGCLVIATPNSGMSEAIHDGQTGFLVDPENPGLLANMIISVLSLNSDEKQQIHKQGYLLVKERFSIEQQVQTLGKLYKKIIGPS